jgi:hypothetical protein
MPSGHVLGEPKDINTKGKLAEKIMWRRINNVR